MKKRGDIGEELASEYLDKNGYEIIERNWRGVKGMRAPEIDIIARENNMIVFVEVKTSTTSKFGRPQEWVTNQKQKRLQQAAEIYLSILENDSVDVRFDVIAIDNSVKPPEIYHIVNAFTVSDII